MSDNEDLLGDDLGDQSLADYNLGNEEEEQLLADDYESGASQNVPSSVGPAYRESVEMVSTQYPAGGMEYNQTMPYQVPVESECVVPNITVEVPNTLPDHSTYAPYEPPAYEPEHAVVPMPVAAMPLEPPQIVPSEITAPAPVEAELAGPRSRFPSERPVGAQRLPQVRDIPDSLDKVFVPGNRGRSWRSAQFAARYHGAHHHHHNHNHNHHHPYRRNYVHRGNFNQRSSFPPPQLRYNPPHIRPDIRPDLRPDIRPELRPDLRPDFRPELHPDMRPELRPDIRPELRPDMRPDLRPDMHPELRPDMRPEIRPDMRPELRPDMRPEIRPDMRPELRPDMRPELRPDMRPELRPDICPELRPDMRPELRPDMRPDLRPDMRPEIRPDMRPELRPDMHPELRPDMRPDIHDLRPDLPESRPDLRPDIHPEFRPESRDLHQMIPEMSPERPENLGRPPFQNFPRFQFRPNLEERPNFGPRPFEQRPMYPYRPGFNPRPFGPPVREIVPNNVSHMPQVTIRQSLPLPKVDKFGPKVGVGPEPEVRMLPVQLPVNLPPGGFAGKKVLINPHFKGNFPPVDGLPTYIPTRIQKSPPLSPTLESKFGPIKDIDDAAERFIAEQRNALARAATRKFFRRSPQRYIENTTIEIENELAGGGRSDDELSRRQEEFINANRAGLRRRMRSPSPPPRRSPPPPAAPPAPPAAPPSRRSPERRRPEPRPSDEDTEYKRRLREQENLRERVLRAKEVRRRKNAVALQKQIQERDRERLEKEEPPKPEAKQADTQTDKPPITEQVKPDTTRKSPEKEVEKYTPRERETVAERERSPVKIVKDDEVNSTCDTLTPPRSRSAPPAESEACLTPPLPQPPTTTTTTTTTDSDDELDLILGDIDGILSDDDDAVTPTEDLRPEPPEKVTKQADLRSKLPPKATEVKRPPRQKIVFREEKEDRKKKEKSPPRKPAPVTSSIKTENVEKPAKMKPKVEAAQASTKSRQRIIFDSKESDKSKEEKPQVSNRRVILQRKMQQKEKSVFSRIEIKSDPTKPNPGIFSRAVRTAIGSENTRIVVKKIDETQIEYESESDVEDEKILEDIGNVAAVTNLPHGMTDTRLKTLAGNDVQSLSLDKEDRSAKITFKTTVAAENFKKKFNNKMVAASRLTVALK